MSKIRSTIKTTLLSLATLFITLGAPIAGISTAYADCAAPAAGTPGVHSPTGSDAGTYTYKCDGPYAGLYYNGYYTYNPTTGARTATFDPDYSYNLYDRRLDKSRLRLQPRRRPVLLTPGCHFRSGWRHY